MCFAGQRQENNLNLVAKRHGEFQEHDLPSPWTLQQGFVIPSLLFIIKMSNRVQASNNKGDKKVEEELSTVSIT